MRLKYISKIQMNMKRSQTIHTSKKTTQVLDGSYRSVYKGRSTNFDELREYAEGDDVKDIDWKASARSRKMLVRQYMAEKKHNILFVMDTNCRMLADTKEREEKREVALVGAGTLACLVNKNGDFISAIYATTKSINHFPFKSGLMHIENILAHYDRAVTRENKSNLNTPLDYVIHNFRRGMIIVIVTDTEGLYNLSEVLLKRLLLLHDVIILNVSDTDISGKQVFDVESGEYMPAYFTRDKKLAKLEAKRKKEIEDACNEKLKRYGVVYSTVDSVEDMDMKVVELLNKHKGEKR